MKSWKERNHQRLWHLSILPWPSKARGCGLWPEWSASLPGSTRVPWWPICLRMEQLMRSSLTFALHHCSTTPSLAGPSLSDLKGVGYRGEVRGVKFLLAWEQPQWGWIRDWWIPQWSHHSDPIPNQHPRRTSDLTLDKLGGPQDHNYLSVNWSMSLVISWCWAGVRSSPLLTRACSWGFVIREAHSITSRDFCDKVVSAHLPSCCRW